ncbi:uncharacterized protein LOC113354465 [Papaver somniferum]|uniref:uncharacterized protein LOC113354465 n=1 Tax=Papaver somniferum TaxID=3469 RepID=UPI000E700556|nr:uncharacterized protein LOC113354465 [Papaver somniferum]
MKTLFLNVGGLRRPRAKDKLRSLVKQFSPTLVWVVEPKIRWNSKDCKSLKLPGMHHKLIHNSTNERKCNIWLFWSASITEPYVVSITNQVITVNVGGVLVSGIHAASLAANRKELWLELEQMSNMDLPWLSIGDFNTVLSVDEKNGGRTPLRVAMKDFHEALNVCNLIQAPKSRLQFTWCNNRAGTKRIACTLDRASFNLKWSEKYLGWSYKVGVRSVSDHSPLLGSCITVPKPKNVPFIVLKVWLEHEDFKRLIQDVWATEVIGNPIVKLTKEEEEVLNATTISDQNPSDTILLNNLVVARGKQEMLNQQLHSILQQKSREKWLKHGAANTRFFHTSIKIRQAANAITELEDDNGSIVTDQHQVVHFLEQHFEEKLKFKNVIFVDGIFYVIPEVVTLEDNKMLEGVPSIQEIKDVVFSLNADNAPGPDGFPVFFIDLLGR